MKKLLASIAALTLAVSSTAQMVGNVKSTEKETNDDDQIEIIQNLNFSYRLATDQLNASFTGSRTLIHILKYSFDLEDFVSNHPRFSYRNYILSWKLFDVQQNIEYSIFQNFDIELITNHWVWPVDVVQEVGKERHSIKLEMRYTFSPLYQTVFLWWKGTLTRNIPGAYELTLALRFDSFILATI